MLDQPIVLKIVQISLYLTFLEVSRRATLLSVSKMRSQVLSYEHGDKSE
jgi:hypothetical protein